MPLFVYILFPSSTRYSKIVVPQTIKGMAVGIGILKCWMHGPSGSIQSNGLLAAGLLLEDLGQ